MSGGTPRPGPAGLAAAARLGPVDPLLIDRSDTVGSTWRTRLDSLRLHTIRWLSGRRHADRIDLWGVGWDPIRHQGAGTLMFTV